MTASLDTLLKFAVPLAFVVSFALRWIYLRVVRRSMLRPSVRMAAPGDATLPASLTPMPKAEKTAAATSAPASNETPATAPAGRKKLGYIEQREYEAIEATLAAAESALRDARAAAEDPAHASDHAKLVALLAAVDDRQAEVDRLYARWAELEAKLAGPSP